MPSQVGFDQESETASAVLIRLRKLLRDVTITRLSIDPPDS